MQIGSIIKNSFKVKGFVFGLVVLLSSISFGYCDDVATLLDTYTVTNVTIPQQGWSTLMDLQSLGLQYKTICIKFIQSNPKTIDWGPTKSYHSQPGTIYRTWWDWISDGKYTCTYLAADRYLNGNSPDGTVTSDIEYFILEDLMATPLPTMTSLQCQTEYGLIPSSSVNQNYCVSNGFCPSYYVRLNEGSLESESALISSDVNLFVGSGIVVNSVESPLYYYFDVSPDLSGGSCVIGSGNWSALYINDIQHESAPLINLTIPEEFDRDYTNDSEEFNLWVSGYNVDTAYIDGIITTQKTLPDKQDFNNTISGLLPLFIPGLVIIACLYFIFRFIKKVF